MSLYFALNRAMNAFGVSAAWTGGIERSAAIIVIVLARMFSPRKTPPPPPPPSRSPLLRTSRGSPPPGFARGRKQGRSLVLRRWRGASRAGTDDIPGGRTDRRLRHITLRATATDDCADRPSPPRHKTEFRQRRSSYIRWASEDNGSSQVHL